MIDGYKDGKNTSEVTWETVGHAEMMMSCQASTRQQSMEVEEPVAAVGDKGEHCKYDIELLYILVPKMT